MISNRKNTLSGKLKHSCLNLLGKVLLCIFIAVMVLITIVSAVPSLLIYLLIGNYSMHNFKRMNAEHP